MSVDYIHLLILVPLTYAAEAEYDAERELLAAMLAEILCEAAKEFATDCDRD